VPEVYYLELGDYWLIATEALGTTPEQIARLPRIALTDSALAVPRSGFADQDAYPTLIEKAAALVEHLVRNHLLPDGNKRCAFLAAKRPRRQRSADPGRRAHRRCTDGRAGAAGDTTFEERIHRVAESDDNRYPDWSTTVAAGWAASVAFLVPSSL
jgi:hypothetical protein